MSHIYSKLNLYRRTWFRASGVIILASLALTISALAFQHRTPHKLRATALVEVTTEAGGTVSAHVFPITILANGTFRDASIYESRPRPLALGNGVVYEAEKNGVPVGFVTITNGSNTLHGWVALGKWQPASQVQARSTPKPTGAPAEPPDDRPILHREGDALPPPPAPAPEQPQSPPSDDRPVLHRSGGDSSQPASTSPSPTPSPSANQTTTQSTGQPAAQPDAEPPAPEDPNRPMLKHRNPHTAAEVDTPPAPVPSKTLPPTVPAQAGATRPPIPTGPGTQTYLAVSDAQSSDTRSYEYNWKPEEKARIEDKMRKLALAQLPGENAQANEHAMTNVVVRSFDLDLSNDAVVVITAEVPGGNLVPAAKATKTGRVAAAGKSAPDKSVSRYVTVIARVDIDGNPQKLAASVTDSSRLDVAPRLELIDAVDVDGDGLAELVFREYDFDQKSFIVYGVGHGTVTKVFEGATEPIK